LDQEAIILVRLLEEDVLQREDLAAVWLADAVDLTGSTATNVLEDTVALDVIRLFHGQWGVHGAEFFLPHSEELGRWSSIESILEIVDSE
jgi:hypothetical protein